MVTRLSDPHSLQFGKGGGARLPAVTHVVLIPPIKDDDTSLGDADKGRRERAARSQRYKRSGEDHPGEQPVNTRLGTREQEGVKLSPQ